MTKQSNHPLNKVVDEVFSISPVSSSLERMSFFRKSSSRAPKFEWPQEIVGFLEVSTNGVNFLNQILNRQNSMFTKSSFNQLVVGQGNSLFIYFAIPSLIDEFLDGFSRWITILIFLNTQR